MSEHELSLINEWLKNHEPKVGKSAEPERQNEVNFKISAETVESNIYTKLLRDAWSITEQNTL